MKKYNYKDYKVRKDVAHYENKRISLKVIQQHLNFSKKKRYDAIIQLSKLKRKSSKIRIRNRCVLTGRSRGVFNYFKISRILIRNLAAKGLIPGLKKAT